MGWDRNDLDRKEDYAKDYAIHTGKEKREGFALTLSCEALFLFWAAPFPRFFAGDTLEVTQPRASQSATGGWVSTKKSPRPPSRSTSRINGRAKNQGLHVFWYRMSAQPPRLLAFFPRELGKLASHFGCRTRCRESPPAGVWTRGASSVLTAFLAQWRKLALPFFNGETKKTQSARTPFPA